ncbi:MAG TPA: carboxypeptidase-like regulatory domain-containing protein, partial [Gemmatimonadaceae bacterium]
MRQLPLLLMLTPLAVLAQGTSELRGRVVNEAGLPIAGATITLAAVGYSIRTDSTGWFVLSGTPGSALVFALGAVGYRTATDSVTLPRRARVSQEFTLRSESSAVPEPNPSDRVLRGRVMDIEGVALTYATIQINGGRRYIADDSGRFTIPLPPARFSLLVRRIGFGPEELTFDAPPDTAIRVRMTAVATALPEQRITGRAAFVSLDLNGFYRRMKDVERGINHGYFITPEDFEFRKPHQITQMVEGYPAVFMKRSRDPRKDIILGNPC